VFKCTKFGDYNWIDYISELDHSSPIFFSILNDKTCNPNFTASTQKKRTSYAFIFVVSVYSILCGKQICLCLFDNEPEGQGTHELEPEDIETQFGGHVVHTVCPEVIEKDPGAQGLHVELSTGEYEPGRHALQISFPLCSYPAIHTHEFRVTVVVWLLGHLVHIVLAKTPAPAAVGYLYRGHEMHCVAPSVME